MNLLKICFVIVLLWAGFPLAIAWTVGQSSSRSHHGLHSSSNNFNGGAWDASSRYSQCYSPRAPPHEGHHYYSPEYDNQYYGENDMNARQQQQQPWPDQGVPPSGNYNNYHEENNNKYYYDEPYDNRKAYMDPKLLNEYMTPDYGYDNEESKYQRPSQMSNHNQLDGGYPQSNQEYSTPLAPYYGGETKPPPPQQQHDPSYPYNNAYNANQEQQGSPIAKRRPGIGSTTSMMDLMDEFLEETNNLFDGSFGMMSPFFGRRSRSPLSSMMMDSPFFFPSPLAALSSSSTLRSMLTEQTSSIHPLLEEAEQYLNQDPACTTALGAPIRVEGVISQSSSSSSINGQTIQSSIQLLVSVQGSNQCGRLKFFATEQGIQQMTLQVVQDERTGDYREINVQLTMGQGNISSEEGDTVVDAEIIP